jgi:hypothetical protein
VAPSLIPVLAANAVREDGTTCTVFPKSGPRKPSRALCVVDRIVSYILSFSGCGRCTGLTMRERPSVNLRIWHSSKISTRLQKFCLGLSTSDDLQSTVLKLAQYFEREYSPSHLRRRSIRPKCCSPSKVLIRALLFVSRKTARKFFVSSYALHLVLLRRSPLDDNSCVRMNCRLAEDGDGDDCGIGDRSVDVHEPGALDVTCSVAGSRSGDTIGSDPRCRRE